MPANLNKPNQPSGDRPSTTTPSSSPRSRRLANLGRNNPRLQRPRLSTSAVRQQRKATEPTPLSIARRIVMTIVLCLGAVLICIGFFVGWEAGLEFGASNVDISAMLDDKETLPNASLITTCFAIWWSLGSGLLAVVLSLLLVAATIPCHHFTYQLKLDGEHKTVDGTAESRRLVSFAFFLLSIATLMLVLNFGAAMFVTV